jgi:hypothetical protein
MARDFIRESIWQSNINSIIGLALIAVCALWASLAIIQTSWHANPITSAFAAVIERETSF